MAKMFPKKVQPKTIKRLSTRRVPSSTPRSSLLEKAKQIYALCVVRMVLIMTSPTKAFLLCFPDSDTITNGHQDGDKRSILGLNECSIQRGDNKLMKWSQLYYWMTTPIELLQSDEITELTSIMDKAHERIRILCQALRNMAYTPDSNNSANNLCIPSLANTHGPSVGPDN